MKVLVLGAGVIGITTAYFIRKDGHDVTVVDRHKHGAMESTFANGAQLSYCHGDPLSSWHNIWQGLKWLGKKKAPLFINTSAINPDLIQWMFKFILQAPNSKREFAIQNLLRLSFYSKEIFSQLNTELNINYDHTKKGILYLLDSKNSLHQELKLFEYYKKFADVNYEIFSKKECINYDPAAEIIMRQKHAGILTMEDEVGDARKFTEGLEKECKKIGVNFLYNCEIKSLQKLGNKITGVHASKGFLTANKFICCMGAYTPMLLGPIGIKTHIYPIKGYSTSVKIQSKKSAPKSSIFDMSRKIVYSTVGNTLRTAGTAEFCGYNHSISESRIKPLIKATNAFFPNAANYDKVFKWTCLRPVTPHYNPYLGPTPYDNLFINSGHGFLGWTNAAGSAKIVAEIAQGKPSPINLNGLTLSSN